MGKTKLKDLGEKEIIRSIVKPLFNPSNKSNLAGDDCAIIETSGKKLVSLSTDRVPADLISFKLGLINYFELGYYLAVLNISDILSSGAKPVGLLLNLAFDENFLVEDFKDILHGAKKACEEYGGQVLGGDLSNATEMNITATSVGTIEHEKALYRNGAQIGDHVYCSDYLGLTSTAFYYFSKAKPKGFTLTEAEENLLVDQFRRPKAKLELSQSLASHDLRITCMDNTDGIGQSFLELSEINNLRFELNLQQLPIHEISAKVAKFLGVKVLNVVLDAGADFQLVGTLDGILEKDSITDRISKELKPIGQTSKGTGVWIRDSAGKMYEFKVTGWDYYSRSQNNW